MCILTFQYILTNCSPQSLLVSTATNKGWKCLVPSHYPQHSISKIQLFVNLKGEGISVLISVYLVVNDDGYLNICLRARYFVFLNSLFVSIPILLIYFSPLPKQSSRLLISKFTNLLYGASYKKFISDVEALKWI